MAAPRRVPRAYVNAEQASPPGVRGGQFVADTTDGTVVVFLIGMRVNRWRRIRSWWPVFTAMPRMVAELKDADRGLLGARTYWSGRVFLVVQYWRSATELGEYARDSSMRHAPAWGAFNKAAAPSGDVGIFHETYLVSASAIESLYGNMPEFGLAAAIGSLERGHASHRSHAHEALDSTEPDYAESA